MTMTHEANTEKFQDYLAKQKEAKDVETTARREAYEAERKATLPEKALTAKEVCDLLIEKCAGKDWKGGDKHRVYIPHDEVLKAAGYEVEYKNGGVKSSTYASNNKTTKFMMSCDKTYFDAVSGTFHGEGKEMMENFFKK